MKALDVGVSRDAGPTLATRIWDVLSSEWTKLFSVRSTYWILLIASVVAIGGSAATSYPDAHGGSPFDPIAAVFVAWLGYPVLAVGLLGALAFTAEYSTGQVRSTFAAVPQRLVVLVAKASVTGIVVLVLGEVLAFAAFVLSEAIRSGSLGQVSVSQPGVIRALLGAGFSLFVIAMVGLGIGAITRQTVGSVVALPAVLYLPLMTLVLAPPWADRIARFTLLMAAYQVVSLHPRPGLFSPLASLLVLVAWPTTLLAIAALLINRRDA